MQDLSADPMAAHQRSVAQRALEWAPVAALVLLALAASITSL